MLKYQTDLMEQEDVEFQGTTALSPVQLLNTPMQGGEPLTHDCLQTIEQVCAGWPDLQGAPTVDPAAEFFTDRSSPVQEGEKPAVQ